MYGCRLQIPWHGDYDGPTRLLEMRYIQLELPKQFFFSQGQP
jgi:hypothetical protein